MAFSIRNPEAETLAREITSLTGESLTAAVTESLRLRLDSLKTRQDYGREQLVAELMEIAHRCASRPNISEVTDQEIFGWDECGLPT